MAKRKYQDSDEVRSVFCLKNKEDMAKIEETDDCFILSFDPFEQENARALASSEDDDADLIVISEKGKVACRDYPHPRHLCAKYPFEKTAPEKYCEKCYCVVCNEPAPCMRWAIGEDEHCKATTRKGPKRQCFCACI